MPNLYTEQILSHKQITKKKLVQVYSLYALSREWLQQNEKWLHYELVFYGKKKEIV